MKRPPGNRRSLRSTHAPTSQPGSPVHIRQSRITDLPALRTMAPLQDTELPAGPFLVAEIRGDIVAAAPVHAGGPSLGTRHSCSGQLQYLLHRQARVSASRIPNL
jgi:hypothetical protein